MKKKNSIMIITFVVCFIFMISACSIKKDGIKPSVTESESHSETTAHSETRATNVNISYIGKKVTTKDGLGITITSINRGDNLAGQDKPASGYEFLSVTFSLKNGGEAHSNMIPYQFHLIFADQLGTQISPTYFPDDTPLKNYHVILPFEEVKDIKLVYEVPIGMVNLLFSYVDYSKTPIFIIPLMAASVEDLVFYGLENDSSNKYVLVQSLQSSLSLTYKYISRGYENRDLNRLSSGDRIRVTSVQQTMYIPNPDRHMSISIILDIEWLGTGPDITEATTISEATTTTEASTETEFMGIEIGMAVEDAIEILDKRESDGDINEWHMREDLALLIAVDGMEIVIETVDGENWEVEAIIIYEATTETTLNYSSETEFMGIEIGMPVDEAIEILDKSESAGDIDEWYMREDLALLIAVDDIEIVVETIDGEIWEVVAIRIYEATSETTLSYSSETEFMGIEIGMPVDEAIEILDKRESDGDIDEWHMREDLALLIAVDSMEIVIETVDGEIWEVVAIRIYE